MTARLRLRRPVLLFLCVFLIGAIVAAVRLGAAGSGRSPAGVSAPAANLLAFEPEGLAATLFAKPAISPSTAPSGDFGPVSTLLTASPNVTYTSGGLTFGPSTIVDFQRTEGEPLGHIDQDGNYWESGPWGFGTAQSFVHRSIDNGDQFNIVSPIQIRPNPPGPGGGDSTIVTDDQGNTYFADLEALADIGCAVSHDDGNNWTTNQECVHTTATDRQWLVVDNGSNHTTGMAGAADNTVFHAFHDVATGHFLYSSPGSTGPMDAVGGVLYTNAIGSSPLAAMYGGGGNCAQITFDPVFRNLYYACGSGNNVDVTVVHVNPGVRNGLSATLRQLPNTPGGTVSNLFPVLSVDTAGNVYVVWSDVGNHHLYYSYSTNQAQTWSTPVRVTDPTGPATSEVFAWAQAGAPGTLTAIWLGANSPLLSDNMPNWQSDPAGAVANPFFGKVALITNANTADPTIDVNNFADKPTHYGQICNSGIGCTLQVPQGDRTMADFLSVAIDPDGALRVVYNDTTSQHHGAHLMETRQLTGPTLLGGVLNRPAPPNPIFDPAGDAQWPHYSPVGAGPNQAQLDMKSFSVNQQTATTLRFRMTFDNLGGATGFLPPPGKANAIAIARFQALSRNDTNVTDAYRIFYVGVESVGGSGGVAPVFFAGSPNLNAGAGGTPGCNTRNPGECKVVQYPPEFLLTTGGQISSNTICIDVPLTAFGATRPINGTKLFNVTAFTGGRNVAVDDLYADVDSTRSFDFTLGTVSPTACVAPTAVKVASFAARASKAGVVLRWRTGTEVDTAGFNVWRGKTKLNRALIAATGGAVGERYSFVDRTAKPGASYTYRLQIVTRNGTRSWSGSARVRR